MIKKQFKFVKTYSAVETAQSVFLMTAAYASPLGGGTSIRRRNPDGSQTKEKDSLSCPFLWSEFRVYKAKKLGVQAVYAVVGWLMVDNGRRENYQLANKVLRRDLVAQVLILP